VVDVRVQAGYGLDRNAQLLRAGARAAHDRPRPRLAEALQAIAAEIEQDRAVYAVICLVEQIRLYLTGDLHLVTALEMPARQLHDGEVGQSSVDLCDTYFHVLIRSANGLPAFHFAVVG